MDSKLRKLWSEIIAIRGEVDFMNFNKNSEQQLLIERYYYELNYYLENYFNELRRDVEQKKIESLETSNSQFNNLMYHTKDLYRDHPYTMNKLSELIDKTKTELNNRLEKEFNKISESLDNISPNDFLSDNAYRLKDKTEKNLTNDPKISIIYKRIEKLLDTIETQDEA